jgi:uncharacterized membrane protein (DUF4010 family)
VPDATLTLIPTFVALLLGALVGLERQVAEGESEGAKDFPGVRTFAFTALLGALSLLAAQHLGPLIAVALFAATVAFMILRYRHQISDRGDVGYTTEVASMCTFALGVLAQANELLVATVITVAMVTLLRSKRLLHRAADLLAPADMEILIRFLVITLIIYPLLPDEPLDVFDGVLRPRDVWRMVVLISGVSFAAYFLMRFRAGAATNLLTGVLSGLVSSTAATLAYARAGRAAEDSRHYESLIALAVSTSFLRMSIMLAIVAPALLLRAAPVLAVMLLAGFALVALRHLPESVLEPRPTVENPLTLRVALTFAAIYACVLVLVHLAQGALGDRAIYGLAAIASLPGADAPTLSFARLVSDGRLDLVVAGRAVAVIAIATTLAKALLLALVGRGPLVPRVATTLIIVAVVGLVAGLLFLR